DQMMGGEQPFPTDVGDANLANVHHVLGRERREHADLPVLVRRDLEGRNPDGVRAASKHRRRGGGGGQGGESQQSGSGQHATGRITGSLPTTSTDLTLPAASAP